MLTNIKIKNKNKKGKHKESCIPQRQSHTKERWLDQGMTHHSQNCNYGLALNSAASKSHPFPLPSGHEIHDSKNNSEEQKKAGRNH